MIAIFIIFKMRMGWKDSAKRFFSSFIASLLIFFLVYAGIAVFKNNVLNVIVFYALFAGISYIMYKSHKEAREEKMQGNVEVQRF